VPLTSPSVFFHLFSFLAVIYSDNVKLTLRLLFCHIGRRDCSFRRQRI
jgi:hypothetical protein